jgi:hypothetical protein
MIKLIVQAWPAPGIDMSFFHNYYRNNHGELARQNAHIMGHLRYEQNHRIRCDVFEALSQKRSWRPAPEGVSMLWFKDHDSLLASIQRQAETGLGPRLRVDESKFTDAENLSPLIAYEHVVLESSDRSADLLERPAKWIIEMRSKVGMTLQAFSDRWRGAHADLVKEVASQLGILRYVQNHRDSTFPLDLAAARRRPAAAEGVSEMWWPSFKAAQEALATKDGIKAAELLYRDEASFTEPTKMFGYLAQAELIGDSSC